MTLIPVTLTIPHPDRDPLTITLTGDQVSAHFALTPTLTARRSDTGEVEIVFADNGLTLIHVPTGRPVVSHEPFIDMRRYARALENLPGIDWSQVTDLADKDVHARLRTVYRQLLDDPADPVNTTAWPQWAGDASEPARGLIGHQLTTRLRDDDRLTARETLAAAVSRLDPELGRRVSSHLLGGLCHEQTASYTLVYLLEVLRREAPEIADRAATHLVRAWEHADEFSSWLHDWAHQHAAGQPLSLLGALPALPAADPAVQDPPAADPDPGHEQRAAATHACDDMPQAWRDLIAALTLLARHPTNPEFPLYFADYMLRVCADDQAFTAEDRAVLDQWGFPTDSDEGGFYSTRYGRT
ncbi:hypothetical protein [Nocardia asiatica]|uniref:hypothetical protein n=1 Tax=Nocardia asiatica TaxID=209252 RepID=UPI000304ACFA|nr:hypothetical protein [Nocardia asiatica]